MEHPIFDQMWRAAEYTERARYCRDYMTERDRRVALLQACGWYLEESLESKWAQYSGEIGNLVRHLREEGIEW
jgi:hypothetical protein